VKENIEAKGGVCAQMLCDVSKEENCQAAVEACVKQFGRLDILVNSAGVSGSKPTLKEHFDTDNYNDVMALDFGGVFFMIKYAYEECAKNGGGSIINISSSAAIRAVGRGNLGPVVYTAAKGAIRSMTNLLGKSFGSINVRINSIYPGLIATGLTAPALANPQFLEETLKSVPLGRVGQPEDIAYCALYLASDAASFVTGQDFIVDGGATC
jgi:NAD(P)-dependent dehydrogenase (short-subunit alcohol dehydrogenase family)